MHRIRSGPGSAMARRKRLNREEKRAVTRRRLLRAARKVFGQRGYHGASLEEIAAEAGFSKGALYYNFKGKEELFLELLEERLAERVDVIRSAFDGEEAPGVQLRDAGRRYVEQLDENREWFLLYFEFWAHAVRERTLTPSLTAALRTFREGVREVIEEHSEELGVDTRLDAEHLAIAANALAVGLAVEKHADPQGVPDELFGETLTRLFLGAPGSKRDDAPRRRPRRRADSPPRRG
jgi:AcrR family transcriptional regulator